MHRRTWRVHLVRPARIHPRFSGLSSPIFTQFSTSSIVSQTKEPTPKTPPTGPERTGLNAITGFFKDFIQKESQAFSASINRNFSALEGELPIEMELDPKLQQDLTKVLDNNHRLFLILTYSPLLINPSIYTLLYEKLENSLDNSSKTLLLRRLLFHRQYQQCWKICLETYTSLTDIEDLLELAFQSFEENDNLSFGLFELLIASQSEEVPSGFKHHVIDTCCHKYHINKEWIQRSLGIWSELENYQTVEDLIDFEQSRELSDINIQMVYLKKMFQILRERNTTKEEVQRLVMSHTNIMKYKGWLSAIGPEFSKSSCLPNSIYNEEGGLSKYLAETTNFEGNISLNANDLLYIIRSDANYNAFHVYGLYANHTKQTNRHLINFLMTKITKSSDISDISEVKHVLYGNYTQLENLQIADAIVRIYFESPADFSTAFHKLTTIPKERKDEVVELFTNSVYDKKKVSVPDTYKLIQFLHSTYEMKAIRLVLLQISTTSKYSTNEQEKLLTLLSKDVHISSKRAILEVFRTILLRSKVTTEPLIGDLFEKLLSVTLRKNLILNRTKNENGEDIQKRAKQPHDIQQLLYLATVKERADFHNMIRALGQTISLMQPKDIAKVVDIIHGRIYSEKFTFVKSWYGKEYLYNNLILDIIKFIERSEEVHSEAIIKMRNIIAGMNKESSKQEKKENFEEALDMEESEGLSTPIGTTSSTSIIQSCLFKLIIKDDPSKASRLLELYKSNKRQLSGKITFMILGILTSHSDINQKVQYLQSFLNTLKQFEYNHKIRQSVIYQILKTLKEDKSVSTESKAWLFELLQESKDTKRIVQKKMTKRNTKKT